MRNRLIGGMVLAAVVFTAAAAFACGNKLVVIPALPRFGQVTAGARPASILAYVPQDSFLAEVVQAIENQTAAKHVGHKVHAVANSVELDEALQTGAYDVVLIDVSAAEEIRKRAESLRTTPIVLPVLFKPTKAEATATEKRFRYLLKAPASPNNYMAAIDEAMALKFKAR